MKQLYISLCVIFLMLGCAGNKTPTKPEFHDITSNVEKQVHDLVNSIRKSQNLTQLDWNEHVAETARDHSENMAAGKTSIGHDGFDARTKEIAKIIAWQRIGENVAFNQDAGDPIVKAVDGWMKSRGHRENILGDFNITGIGVAENSGGYYFTQIFVKGE